MLRKMVVLLVLALAIAPASAVADEIGFSAIGLGGTWSWNGSDPLTAGFNLTIAHSGVNSTNLGAMTITTGAFLGGSGTSGDPFSFGPGGSITVAGCGGFCFEAEFVSLQVVFNASGGGVILNGEFISGSIHPDLLAALGLSGQGGEVAGHITVSLSGSISANGGSGPSGSADATVTPVPEPASLALLGTGLLGLASRFRKKLSA